MDSPSSFVGGCACGAVRYECNAAPLATLHCHCRDCQRASGGACSTVVVVPLAALVVQKGAAKYHETRADSGNTVRRGFCAECGSPLFGESQAAPQFVALKAASLDDPSWLKPMADIWTASAQPWACMAPGLPKFPKDPSFSPQ